jgi:Sigma-70 region 2
MCALTIARPASGNASRSISTIYGYPFTAISCRLSSGASASHAEDIAQESMIRLYRQLHQGARIPEVRPWVFHVAHNLLIDEKSASIEASKIGLPGSGEESGTGRPGAKSGRTRNATRADPPSL